MIAVFSQQGGNLPRKRKINPYLSVAKSLFNPFHQAIDIGRVVFQRRMLRVYGDAPDPSFLFGTIRHVHILSRMGCVSRVLVAPNALTAESPSENRGLVPMRLALIKKRRETFCCIDADTGQGHHLLGILVSLPLGHFDLCVEHLLGHSDRILA